MSITDEPGYDELMEMLDTLNTQYGTMAGKARTAMLDAKFRGETAKANSFIAQIKAMSDAHEEAVELIQEKLVSPAQLTATRSALQTATTRATDFLETLDAVAMTLDKATEAAGFLTDLLGDLRQIFP